MSKTFNYKEEYLIVEENNKIIINIPFKEDIFTIENIKFKENSIFLVGKNKNKENIAGEISNQGKIISYLKTKNNFIINILNKDAKVILATFNISK